MYKSKKFDINSAADFPSLRKPATAIIATLQTPVNIFPDMPLLKDFPSKHEWNIKVKEVEERCKQNKYGTYEPANYDEFVNQATVVQTFLTKSKHTPLSYTEIRDMIAAHSYLVDNIIKIYISNDKKIPYSSSTYGIINASMSDNQLYCLVGYCNRKICGCSKTKFMMLNENKNIVPYLSCFEQKHADYLVYKYYDNYYNLNDKLKSVELTDFILDGLIKSSNEYDISNQKSSDVRNSYEFLVRGLIKNFCKTFDDWNNVGGKLRTILSNIIYNFINADDHKKQILLKYQSDNQELYQMNYNEVVSELIDECINEMTIQSYPELNEFKQQLKHELYQIITDFEKICSLYKNIKTDKYEFDVPHSKGKTEWCFYNNTLQEKLDVYTKHIKTCSQFIDNLESRKQRINSENENREHDDEVMSDEYDLEAYVVVYDENDDKSTQKQREEQKIKDQCEAEIMAQIKNSHNINFESPLEVVYDDENLDVIKITSEEHKNVADIVMYTQRYHTNFETIKIHTYEQLLKLFRILPDSRKMFTTEWTKFKPNFDIKSHDDFTEEMWGALCEADGNILRTLSDELRNIIKQKYNVYTTTRCWSCFLRKPCYKYRGTCSQTGYANMFECDSCGDKFDAMEKSEGGIYGCLHCYHGVAYH